MLIYTISLCAVVAVTYLIQLQAYSHYHGGDAGTDVSPITGLPIKHAFGYELVVEEQVSALT